MVLHARLRIRHHGCVSEQVVDGARVLHLSGDETHCLTVFHATGPGQLEALLAGSAAFLEPGGLIDRAEDWAVARCHCPREGSAILPLVRAAGCTTVWPFVHAEGHEHLTVLAPSRTRLQALVAALRRVGDVTVETTRTVAGSVLDVNVSLGDVTQDLTRRQLEALRLAVASGYYDTPRKVGVEALATAFGLSRSTFQEHLQKAESHVIRTFSALLLEHPALAGEALKSRGRPRRRHPPTVLRP